jgi:hypothetical protein
LSRVKELKDDQFNELKTKMVEMLIEQKKTVDEILIYFTENYRDSEQP